MFSKKNLCLLVTASLTSMIVSADRYYHPSETSEVTAENQYTAKPYTLKLAPEKRIGDMYLNKVISKGEKPLIYGHQRPRDPMYLFADRDVLLTLRHFKAKVESAQMNYYGMHMELSSKDAIKCISEQTKEVFKSKYFKAVHKDHTAAVVLWDKSAINTSNQLHDIANQNDIFKKPEFHVDVGESDEKSEFSVILKDGYCDVTYSWKIDRVLKERYPEIAAKVDKEIEEKLAESSNDQRKPQKEREKTESQSEAEKSNGSSLR